MCFFHWFAPLRSVRKYKRIFYILMIWGETKAFQIFTLHTQKSHQLTNDLKPFPMLFCLKRVGILTFFPPYNK